MELWYDANSNRLVMDGLTAEVSPGEDDYIDDAFVTATIYDGADAVEGVEDVELTATGEGGRYEKVFAPDDVELAVGEKYRATITAVSDGNQLEVDVTLKVERRRVA